MDSFETIWKILAAGAIIWRLAIVLFEETAAGSGSRRQRVSVESFGEADRSGSQDLPASRCMDCLLLATVWMSAQTTIWAACGFTGVVLNWVAFSGISRLRTASRAKMGAEFPKEVASAAPSQALDGAARLCL